MAESFPSTIATNILATIAFLNSKKERFSGYIPEEIMDLKVTLLKIKEDLLNAEEQQAQNRVLREYLAQLSDQLYDAEDVVDEVECELEKPSNKELKVSRLIPRCSSIPYVKESRKLDDIIKRLDEIVAAVKSKCDQNKREVWRVNWREMMINQTCVGASEVFGRDGDKENIINFLKQPNNEGEKVSVITIVGGGGIGKTTLAKLVYSDKKIDELFDIKMWVSVPEDFDMITLMKETCTSATGQNQAGLAVKELEDRLLKELDGKKFLLVLDDVWNENYDKWDKFKNLLTQKPNGSKIVVTTRNERVASIMGTVLSHNLGDLSQADSFQLFVKSAFRDKPNEELAEIGKEIVNKCDRLPLAVKTLGTLLYQNTKKSDWMLIKNNDVWRQEQEENKILSVLKLSYDHLPSHLQRCLTYCSLFSKGYSFNSNYLVCYWMAQGFLVAQNEHERLEDVGLKYLEELICSCFFQDVENHGYYFTFKMHDFIHDLLQKVVQTDCETVDLRFQNNKRNVRHLSFLDMDNCIQEVPSISKKLRTIIMQSVLSEHVSKSFVNTWISGFKYLRSLCLSGLQFEELPGSVGALNHLKFLDLSWNLILKELLEAVWKLRDLQTFRLLGCSSLKKLPNDIQKMRSLRFLEITAQEIHLAEVGIEGLSSLQYLHLYHCHHLESLHEGMRCLTSLRTLILQGCDSLNSLSDDMKHLEKLEKLVISSCPKLNMKMKMDLRGIDLRFNLKVFMIHELQELVDLPQVILQGSAKTLEYLRIEACPKLTKLPAWLANLTVLQKLEIVSCPQLSSLPDGMEKLAALRILKIQKSPTLSESCRQNGSNISHVPQIHLDPAVASSSRGQ